MSNPNNKDIISSPVKLTETFQCVSDDRGALCVAQRNLLHQPFDIKRIFWIYNVPKNAIRGEHANRSCTELLVAVHGSVKIWLTDGISECETVLDRPDRGLYIPPMVWCKLMDFSPGCVCVCMANQDYDESLYINDYQEFINDIRNGN